MFKRNLLVQALGFATLYVTDKDAKAHNKGAKANENVAAAIQAGAKAGTVVPTIKEFAAQEAVILMESSLSRIKIWLQVIPAYADDIDELMKYPGEVKKAYAAKMGFDLSKHRSKWMLPDGKTHDVAKVKLYDAFVANQMSGLSLICELCKAKGDKGVSAMALLSGVGTLPQKLTEARIQLGRPIKKRGVKANAAHAAVAAATGTSAQDVTKMDETGKVTLEGKGGDKWDLTDLKKRRPIEAIVLLIASGITSTDCITVLKACRTRLVKSADKYEVIVGQRVESALEQFDRDINAVDENDINDDQTTIQEVTGQKAQAA